MPLNGFQQYYILIYLLCTWIYYLRGRGTHMYCLHLTHKGPGKFWFTSFKSVLFTKKFDNRSIQSNIKINSTLLKLVNEKCIWIFKVYGIFNVIIRKKLKTYLKMWHDRSQVETILTNLNQFSKVFRVSGPSIFNGTDKK